MRVPQPLAGLSRPCVESDGLCAHARAGAHMLTHTHSTEGCVSTRTAQIRHSAAVRVLGTLWSTHGWGGCGAGGAAAHHRVVRELARSAREVHPGAHAHARSDAGSHAHARTRVHARVDAGVHAQELPQCDRAHHTVERRRVRWPVLPRPAARPVCPLYNHGFVHEPRCVGPASSRLPRTRTRTSANRTLSTI